VDGVGDDAYEGDEDVGGAGPWEVLFADLALVEVAPETPEADALVELLVDVLELFAEPGGEALLLGGGEADVLDRYGGLPT
jgi:hypothetical protein